MGSLYWQLNDIWEGPSWSSLEYDGTWKLLHYMAKNFYVKLLVSVVEVGDNIEFWLTSDFLVDIEGELTVKVWRWDSVSSVPTHVIHHPTTCLSSTSHCCLKVEKKNFLAFGKREEIFLKFYLVPSQPTSSHYAFNTFFFSPLKNVHLAKPTINLQLQQTNNDNNNNLNNTSFKITLTSNVIAPFVYLTSEGVLGNFSDNGMLLLANEPVEVLFVVWKGSVSVESFSKSLSVCSLRESY